MPAPHFDTEVTSVTDRDLQGRQSFAEKVRQCETRRECHGRVMDESWTSHGDHGDGVMVLHGTLCVSMCYELRSCVMNSFTWKRDVQWQIQ